ncbi:hypothetical protein SCP_0310250 [Sparassis crispa]|uniref:Uncharacterized protein n=1 Tax=Sparassis crispa TaxID=139825 RepID=A0A401GGJ7_9APHY|nr:hypothetical protein SCP_0310250 [Sparassis crispa]GBE81298.1 hypothetical protein SCP_0310250 [Sparassis crispa]
MTAGDDIIPPAYSYAWTPNSDIPLSDFLTKYKPSMVQDDGTKPWLWVRKPVQGRENDNAEAAIEEAAEYLKEVTEKVEVVKNDPSVPIRSNKKKGLKSKKEVREEIQAQATEKLKEISLRHSYVVGKWLIFAPPERVDAIWLTIANSLILGPLSDTCADTAKVATCSQNETANHTHVLCLYMPNVYDKSIVTEVMKVLLGKHGMTLTGVKSDLYTLIGLDSKHPSGVPSTVWKNAALLKDSEIKDLKDKYFAELNTPKDAATDKVTTPAPVKAKPALKKKVVDDDPFASDDNDTDKAKTSERNSAKEAKPASAGPSKAKPQPKKKSEDAFVSDVDEEVEAEASRKAQVAVKKVPAKKKPVAKRSKDSDDDDDNEVEERPKKRLITGRK